MGVLCIFTLALVLNLALTLYWIDSIFLSRKLFSFLAPLKKSIHEQPQRRFWIAFLLFLSFVFLQISLTGNVENYLDKLFFSTVQPLILWSFLVSFSSFLVEILPNDENQSVIDEFWKRSIAIFLLFFTVGTALQLLGFGFTQQSRIAGNFELTGYPIVGYQVFFAAIPALFVSYLLRKMPREPIDKNKRRLRAVDISICLILLIAALIAWEPIPVQTNMFWDVPRPPNFESYPNSDANTYDRTALNLLTVGKLQTYTYRFDEFIGRRPYLALYLAGLHSLTNSNYPEMISIQQVFFSILPILIYLLVTSLHSRPSGVLAGLLIIIRERNGLLLSDTVTGVQSQLLMSEILTLMVLVLFLLVLNNAFLKKTNRGPRFLLAGGILGVAMLIRQEVGVLLPAIAVGLLIVNRNKLRNVISQVTLLLAGMILVITPWMIRNWTVSGKIYFDVPGNRLDSIYRTLGIDRDWWKPEQSENPQSSRVEDGSFAAENLPQERKISSSAKSGSIIQPVTAFQEENDPAPTRFEIIANHFTNQLIQSVVYLPSYPLYFDLDFISKMLIGKSDRYYGGIIYSPQKYVKILPYWWSDWSGKIPPKSLVPTALVVFWIASGISAAWRKERSTALNPLFSYLGYILIYSLVRASGGRFLQEIDWIILVYFSIGMIETLNYLFWNRGEQSIPLLIEMGHNNQLARNRRFEVYPLLIGCLIFAGSLPVILEGSIPSLYNEKILSATVKVILEDPQDLLRTEDQNRLADFISEQGSAMIGKAYYPRYFEIGENLGDIRPEILGKKEDRYDYQRTEFYLIGTDTSWVLLKNEKIPDDFPNGSEVLTIGCHKDGIVDAVAVMILDGHGAIDRLYWRDDKMYVPSTCPLQESR